MKAFTYAEIVADLLADGWRPFEPSAEQRQQGIKRIWKLLNDQHTLVRPGTHQKKGVRTRNAELANLKCSEEGIPVHGVPQGVPDCAPGGALPIEVRTIQRERRC